MQGSPLLPDPDADLRRSLRRHRFLATGMLAGMAGLLVGTYWMPPGYWTDLLQASAKAGVVGGLADWFAVTALFRHPLGIPIPHTAIVPNQKERLGRALGRFVSSHVFTEAELRRVIGRLDLARIVQRFLADPAAMRPAAEALAGNMPKLVASLEDGRARRLLVRLLPRIVSGPAGARLVSRVLRAFVASGRHQEVFSLAIGQLKVLLTAREEALRGVIEARIRAEGGAVIGWLAGATVAKRILAAINTELGKVEPEDSELRAAFAEWLGHEIERLETDPERAEAIGRVLREALAHPSVAMWLMDVWGRLRAALVADAARPDGRTVALLSGVFANAGAMLADDPGARERLNQAVERVLMTLLPSAQAQLSDFIAGVVGNWDAKSASEKIELRVGADLQYVRINGTLVGFLAGGALFALLSAMFGRVAS
ncbi:DUF445 domain-containing protein [Roseomonas terrae]|uniref:DUF445 domain-containing protein n=1 Tax=Neoroseomonas terrae TaxID=424799 RepID=A0ABS5EQ30_9PROT|nr:DUF445 domain-containing protein [Neoroseomonas terrae]MBR0653141.1 DUF445 domain-containing protein [Neoroseomonas terrae]